MNAKIERNGIVGVISHREASYRLNKANFLPRREKIGIKRQVRTRELPYDNAHQRHAAIAVFRAIQGLHAQILKEFVRCIFNLISAGLKDLSYKDASWWLLGWPLSGGTH
jgi:hypothetical protein